MTGELALRRLFARQLSRMALAAALAFLTLASALALLGASGWSHARLPAGSVDRVLTLRDGRLEEGEA